MSHAPAPSSQPASCPPVPWWRRPDAIAVGALLALTLVALWHRWVFDNWLARHDLLAFFLPWLGALGDRLAAGDVPALNPYIFSGAPFAGDPESGWMYLPAMLLFPFFEVTVAYKLMILLLLVLAGTSTYGLARLLGYSVLAALFSAVAFEFGPFLYGQTDCCTVGVNMTAFLPMAFLGVELGLRARTWPSRLAAWSLGGIAISQMFAAWLGQGVVDALLLVGAWVVFRTLVTPPVPGWSWRERGIGLITTGPAVVILGLLLGAAGILPRLAANAESNNAGGTYENTPKAADYPFHTLASLLHSVLSDAPAFRGTSVWGVVAVLAILAIFLARRRSVIPFFGVVALVIPALAMGVPVIADAFYLLPLFENMHAHSPGRVLWVYPFIPAMLAGAAVNELPRLRRTRVGLLVAIVPVALLALAGWYVERERDAQLGGWFWTGALVTTAIVVLVAALPSRIGRAARERIVQGAVTALIALVFLLPNGVDIVNTLRQEDPPPGELVMWGNDAWMQNLIHESLRQDDPGGAGGFLRQRQETESPFRFIAYGGMYHPDTVRRSYPQRRLEPAMVAILQNARPMRLELATTQGYNPVQPLVYQEFMQALNGQIQDYHFANLLYTGVSSPLLDLLAVRYIVVDRNIPETRDDHRAIAERGVAVFRDDQVVIYEMPTARPMAWMVYDVRPAPADGSLDPLASGQVDGAEVAFVEGQPPVTAPPDAGAVPEVSVTAWRPDGLTVEVSHSGKGLLVVSQVYSEGWNATVDEKEVDVLQTDHALLGIPVDAGEHTIELRYAPESLRLGLWVSGLSGLAATGALGAGLAAMLRRRRDAARGAELAMKPPHGEV